MATIKPVKRKGGEAYRISFSHPKTKKYVRRIVHCSRAEAEKIRKRIEADIAFGKFNIETNRDSLFHWSDLKERYLDYSKRNKASTTFEREQSVLSTFAKFLGSDLPLKSIATVIFEKYKEHRSREGRKPATISIELRILKSTFNKAVEWGMLEKDPVRRVGLPKVGTITVRYLREEEIQELLDVIIDSGNVDFERLVVAFLHSGARRSELLVPQFTWDNVDFNEQRILLNGKGQKRRFVPMNDSLKRIFEDLRSEGKKVPFAFNPDFVTHKIADYYRDASIKGANLHSLRKTFGSLLLQNGLADIYTVSRLLGHASVKTTEKYYVDLLDENYRSSVMGLDQVLNYH